MSLRDGPFSDIKPPLTWLAVAALAVAVLASLVLFFGDRRDDAHTGVSAARRSADATRRATTSWRGRRTTSSDASSPPPGYGGTRPTDCGTRTPASPPCWE